MSEPSAIFSPCRTWRYTLHRHWWTDPPGLKVAFIGLNPSTADETQDDPTVRRCLGYAKRWGFNGMFMLNIFALRSTDPKALYRVPLRDAIGPENEQNIIQVVQKPEVSLVIGCWGAHGVLGNQGWRIKDVVNHWFAGVVNGTLKEFCHLGTLTKNKQPRHVLYLPGRLQPVSL